MPHAVFSPGAQASGGDFVGRPMIPGVEPGGSRVGQPTKPALLIKNAWVELQDISLASTDAQGWRIGLKLSQETDLSPGLVLPVAVLLGSSDGTSNHLFKGILDQTPRESMLGSLWAPKMVGVRLDEIGVGSTLTASVHLDYERVDVPWMDWFIMWEFLDGIADNERQY